MSSKALGLIEVRGLLSAITATDAALKAADVRLIDKQTIRGGLTTVELFGDVAAVNSAVEAGVDALSNTNNLISSHLIARLDEQVEQMIIREFERKNKQQNTQQSNQQDVQSNEQSEESESEESELSDSSEDSNELISESDSEQPSDNLDEEDSKKYSEDELRDMKVTQLRSLAYKSNVIGIEKSQIKYANKEKLVEVLSSEGGIN
ncbi:BMC domain-containing protein [Aerococcaceae bacterium WGS1372]